MILPHAGHAEPFIAATGLLRLRRALPESTPAPAGRIAALGADKALYPLFGGVVDTALHDAGWVGGLGGGLRRRGPGSVHRGRPAGGPRLVFARAVQDPGVKPAVAVVGTIRGLRGVRDRYFELQVASLRRIGVDAEFFEPEDLPGRTACGWAAT